MKLTRYQEQIGFRTGECAHCNTLDALLTDGLCLTCQTNPEVFTNPVTELAGYRPLHGLPLPPARHQTGDECPACGRPAVGYSELCRSCHEAAS